MSGADDRLAALEARLAQLEDHHAIFQLIASFGPAVDRGDGAAAAALWAQDGRYDFGSAVLDGAEAVARLVDLPSHRAYLDQGCAHILSLPQISITGDTARAVNYSQVLLHDGADRWKVARCSANLWLLRREAAGWRVVQRSNRLLNGQEAHAALLDIDAAPPASGRG